MGSTRGKAWPGNIFIQRLSASYKNLLGRRLSHSAAKESRPGEVNGSFRFLFDKHGEGSGSGASEAEPELCVSVNWLLLEPLSSSLPGSLDMAGADF